MSKMYSNAGELLAEMATKPDRHGLSDAPEPQSSTAEGVRGKIYGGGAAQPAPAARQRRATARVKKRRFSLATLFVTVSLISLFVLLYVSNVVTVNYLLGDISRKEAEHRRLLMEQDLLRAELTRFQSLETIHPRALNDVGLEDPLKPPYQLRGESNQ